MKRNGKWGVLASFALAAGLTQFLWLNFAPILNLVEIRFGVTESQAGLLLLIFPLVYVLLSIHAGALTDRRGYRRSILLGTFLMALFSSARVYLGNFWFLFAAQVGIAIAQPYVVNAISKLVLDWFEKKHEALATGLGTMGMFIGMALGLAATPPLVEAYGLEKTMFVFAIVSWLVFLACLVWTRPNPSRKQAKEAASDFGKDLKKIMKNPELVLVFLLSFLGLGYFNGLTTWLEPILAPNGLDSIQAGMAGGMLIAGGIVGSALIPALSDAIKQRKPLLIACIAIGCATLYPLTATASYHWVLVLAALQGFFFLPAFALLLEMASELAGPKLAGSATGLLMLTGNLGGVVVIVGMEWIKGGAPTFERAIFLLLGLLALAILMSFRLGETFGLKAHA